MSIPKPDERSSVNMSHEILTSPISQGLVHQNHQDEETSDCPLLTPSPPPNETSNTLDSPAFKTHNDVSTSLDQTLNNFNCEDGLAFLNIVNACKSMHDEPSSRDPMVETSSNSGSSSDTNEPVCTQLLTQLNTAYTHLAPDAQALFYNQDNGPPLTGIQLIVPKPPKNYGFMSWNWDIIRKTFFWSFMSLFAGCIALAIGVICTMPKKCDPPVEWWQGNLFYEIFPASFQDSYKNDGIGDFQGIINRLDYLEDLKVKGIRLNSIFLSDNYPRDYKNIKSLTEFDPILGTKDDFTNMVSTIHQRNMRIILDLPLYPFVKSLEADLNSTSTLNRRKREESSTLLNIPSRLETMGNLLKAPAQMNLKLVAPLDNQIDVNYLEDNIVTKAVRFWHLKGIDGLYLKGLEHYTNSSNFIVLLRHWKKILGDDKILMCSETAVNVLEEAPRNAILNIVNLVDVNLYENVTNGTTSIRDQVSDVFKGWLFQKAGYPWVHWTTGSVDTPRLASTLKVANASVAIAMMGMMLPGTPSIFYGDELGILNSEGVSSHLHQLTPMRWDGDDKRNTKSWIPESAKPASSNLTGLLPKMLKLRSETPPIYVKAVLKNKNTVANGNVRYTKDEMLVIERWYPRRNTYVFVSNLGKNMQTKDLSSLYYAGYVIVGPEHQLNRNIYFKELTIYPGEAFIIKLDK